jgi:methyl-accepting chemotaxis protein
MEDIRSSSQVSSDKIIALGKQSENINDVVKTIDRIIEDTKLIAFNATIEAARAKDEGKGFGVVALEIKRLAEEVFESTEDIKELIQEIQSASHALVLATEEEMKTVHRGTLLAEEAGTSLEQIFEMVKLTTESAQRIASATRQQQGASEQVLQSVEAANQSTDKFSQESKKLAVTAAELNILADGLRQIIEKFET